MKILFSADWHLGYELGGANPAPRLDDQLRQIRKIAGYIEEHDVDVLAIAGDVFEAQERGKARQAIGGMMDALAAPLSRGLRLIAVAGNHDRDWFIETANLWLGADAAGEGRITLRTRPDLVTVRKGDDAVNFVLAPFPTAARYDLRQTDAAGAGQRNELLAKRYIEELELLRRRSAEQRLPAVLLTHVTVEGTEVGPYKISPRDDVVIPRGGFPEFELTVIGHIHKPERIGSAHFYYVGALDRMDVSERDYGARVLLADVGPQGVRSVESLPLDPTPFERVVAATEDELYAAHARMERPLETLVKLTLQVPYGAYTQPLVEVARRIFPRLYGNVEHDWQDVPVVAPAIEGLNTADVEGTVRRYLEEQQMPEAERDALLALVRELREAKAER